MVVHDPYDIPNVKSAGFVVAPGTDATAVVTPTIVCIIIMFTTFF